MGRFKFSKVGVFEAKDLESKSQEELKKIIDERPDLMIIHNLCAVAERLEQLLDFFGRLNSGGPRFYVPTVPPGFIGKN